MPVIVLIKGISPVFNIIKSSHIKKGKKDSNPAVREARAEYETAFINHIEDEMKIINAKPGETIILSSDIKIRKSK